MFSSVKYILKNGLRRNEEVWSEKELIIFVDFLLVL